MHRRFSSIVKPSKGSASGPDDKDTDSITSTIVQDSQIVPPSLTIKRVDHYYSKWYKSWKYKSMGSKVTVESVPLLNRGDNDPWKDYLFVIVRELNENDKLPPLFKIVVKSEYILKACKDVIQSWPGISWNSDPLELNPEIFLTFLDKFIAYRDDLAAKPKKSDVDTYVLQAVDVLLNTIQKEKRAKIQFTPETEFELRVHNLLNKDAGDHRSRLLSLYGHASNAVAPSLKAFTDGSCIDNASSTARAGAGVYLGPGNSKKNELSYRVTGPQTNNRGELLAALVALQRTPLHRPLELFTDSTYLIRSLVYWAWKNSQLGWKCANADMLKALVDWVRARSAPLCLTHVRAHSGNAHNDKADALAKRGATLPMPLPGSDADLLAKSSPPLFSECNSEIPKLNTSLPESDVPAEPKHARTRSGTAHRGRSHLRNRRANFLSELKEAAEDGSAAFWRFYKRARYPLAPESGVGMDDLYGVFVPRMNPPDVTKSGFDPELLKDEKARANRIPLPSPPSSHPAFNGLVSSDDIAEVKSYLNEHPHSETKGADDASYAQLMGVDNEKLRDIFRESFGERKFSRAWLITMIIAVIKSGKNTGDPNSYRAIALECCILKFASLLILLKLRQALDTAGIIPPSQNGFRSGHRTNNNAFVLRHLVEKAFSEQGNLFVAFVDISNAFPSMNQDSLWNKLAHYGLTGQYFDWLRTLYDNMTYRLAHDGKLSDVYRALCGVLMGDPSSPTLWNVFLSTLDLPDDPDDACLDETIISHLEHADDIILISRTAGGLQLHLSSLHRWCLSNFLVLSAGKTWVMIFGALPDPLPVFVMAGSTLVVKDRVRYVGVHFQSTHKEIFVQHYREKCRAAITASRGIFGCELLAGRRKMPPEVMLRLYTALVDCHLISGCEVVIDNHEPSIASLEKIQIRFMRRMLGLSPRSIIAPLHTETGIMPIRTRRVIIALGYLPYLLGLADIEYPSHALKESNRLRTEGFRCWLMDLDFAIRKLPGDLSLPPLCELNLGTVDSLIKSIRRATLKDLQRQIDDSSRLALLHGRLEPQEEGPAHYNPLFLRHYLKRIVDAGDRLAVTRLLCGELTPVIFRCSPGKTGFDPASWVNRRCRACAHHLETPEHVLLQCTGDAAIVRLRGDFCVSMLTSCPLGGEFTDTTALFYLKRWIFHWDDVVPTSRFIGAVLARWKELLRLHLASALIEGGVEEMDVRDTVLLIDDDAEDLREEEELGWEEWFSD